MDLLNIKGPSGEEKDVAQYVQERLLAEGLPKRAMSFDTAHKRIPMPTQTGNLIVHLPGNGRMKRVPRRLLVAHMDTVDIAAGTTPKKSGKFIRPSKGHALGADDRTGVGTVLLTLIRLLREAPAHPPVTGLFTVREETGLWGARMVDVKKLKKPAMGFSFDGGDVNAFLVAAVGSDRMDIKVTGVASHGGGAPEKGVSAAVIGSLAIAELEKKGLHGLIKTGKDRATANIGNVNGGVFHNIVCPEVNITAEARAYRLKTLNRLVTEYKKAFERAVKQVRSADGKAGGVDFKTTRLYYPFVLSGGEPVIGLTGKAIAAQGMKPKAEWSAGGLDANWLARHGIPTVTLGAGAHSPHTTYEYLNLEEFEKAVALAPLLVTVE